jgi:hypothetical protein
MTLSPTGVNIRTYQVGFGDCFLLSVRYPDDVEKHVLIDFGSTGLPPGASQTRMMDIAQDIKARTGGKLTAVVATHRHKDHISGFETKPGGKGTGDVIAALDPDLVVQPWTEHPQLATSATGPPALGVLAPKQARALSLMQAVAGHSLAEARRSRSMPKALKAELSFVGDDNLSNLSAVKNLMTMGRGRSYVYCGGESGLEALLPGVKVHVLGPPTVDQTDTIRKQRSRDPDEFWQLQAGAMSLAGSGEDQDHGRQDDGEDGHGGRVLFPGHVASRGPSFPIDARWLVYHARAIRADQLLQIVRMLDDAMNNTSVILLFEIAGKSLLFPGDAQIENWAYALSQDELKPLLEGVNLYKVGHHGSLNATPKSLWKLFQNRSKVETAARLVSLMSTMPGKHGSEAKDTEVPRRTLVSALGSESDLFSTETLEGAAFFHDTRL